jgi:tRNA (guanine-N1)-methyltransferase
VPEVLIGGNHAEIRKWRESAAVEKTKRLRPDLMSPGRDLTGPKPDSTVRPSDAADAERFKAE